MRAAFTVWATHLHTPAPEALKLAVFSGERGCADDVVPAGDEQLNEPPPDGSGRACKKILIRSPFVVTLVETSDGISL
jgi:hypothetical protein